MNNHNWQRAYFLSNEKETFVFKNISEAPIPSINRGFSAPIKIESALSVENLAF